MAENEFPVVIVGGGPVGLVLSMELSTRGVRHLLVNERETTATHPKGSTINCRSMEILRRLGAAPAVRKTGIPADHPSDVTYVTRFAGYELGRLAMPSRDEKIAKPGPWGETLLTPEPVQRSNQMYFEAVFRAHAESFAAADIRYAWRMNSFTDHGDRVAAEIEDLATGKTETVTCDYFIGCDGANGMVRRQLGFKYEGRDSSGGRFYDGRMLSAFMRAPQAYDVLNVPISWHYQTINHDGRTDCITLDGKGDFLMLADIHPDQPFAEIDAVEMFRTAVGTDIEIEAVSVQEWMAGLAMVTDGYQKGRVYLAGDSIHLFTPSGGFGFNTGIEDAANLGWKLAAALQGWGGDGLIDTYETERRPIGIRNTTASGNFANQIATLEFPPILEEDSAAGEAARDEMREALKAFKEEFASLGIQLGARYDASPIIVADGTAPPADDKATYIPSACPGGRAPHYWLAGNQSLFDQFGPWFTLLRLGPSPADGGAFVAAAKKLDIPLIVVDVEDADARALYESDLALIRPDQHVAWRGGAAADAANILATVIGKS